MNNRHESSFKNSAFCDSSLPDAEGRLTPRLEDYLDYLCAPLVGIVHYSARHDFRTEARAHLEALTAEYQELKMTHSDALETAFREFGDPWKLGRAFLREWERNAPAKMRRSQTPTACAFAWFGAATVINLLRFEWWALEVQWQYHELSGVAPNPFIAAGITPLVAGLLTGLTQPYLDVKAVLRVQTALLLFTLLFGLTFLPHVDVLNLAVIQLFWWLPAGYLTTVTVATMAQRLRRPRFRRTTVTPRPAL